MPSYSSRGLRHVLPETCCPCYYREESGQSMPYLIHSGGRVLMVALFLFSNPEAGSKRGVASGAFVLAEVQV